MPASNKIKIIVTGDSGVGKTSLILRYVENTFRDSYISAIGIKQKDIEINGISHTLEIVDTVGQENYRTVNGSYYRGCHGIAVVYDTTCLASFTNTKQWLGEVHKNCPSSVKVLIGNKIDEESKQIVCELQAKAMAEANNALFLQTSAKNYTNVEQAFTMLATKAVQKISDKESETSADNNVRVPRRRRCTLL